MKNEKIRVGKGNHIHCKIKKNGQLECELKIKKENYDEESVLLANKIDEIHFYGNVKVEYDKPDKHISFTLKDKDEKWFCTSRKDNGNKSFECFIP